MAQGLHGFSDESAGFVGGGDDRSPRSRFFKGTLCGTSLSEAKGVAVVENDIGYLSAADSARAGKPPMAPALVVLAAGFSKEGQRYHHWARVSGSEINGRISSGEAVGVWTPAVSFGTDCST